MSISTKYSHNDKVLVGSYAAISMQLLKRAITLHSKVEIVYGDFVIDVGGRSYHLSSYYSKDDNFDDLYNLECALKNEEDKNAEEIRVRNLKIVALSKLTAEEKLVLGV